MPIRNYGLSVTLPHQVLSVLTLLLKSYTSVIAQHPDAGDETHHSGRQPMAFGDQIYSAFARSLSHFKVSGFLLIWLRVLNALPTPAD